VDLIQRNLQQTAESETAGVQFLPAATFNTFSQSGETYTHQFAAESSCNNFQISRRVTLPGSPVQQSESAPRCNLEINQVNYGVPCSGNENREVAWNFVSPPMQHFHQPENLNSNNPNPRNPNNVDHHPLFSANLPVPVTEQDLIYRYSGSTWGDLIFNSNMQNRSQRTELNMNQDDIKEEKYGGRDVENGNERSLFEAGVTTEPFLLGNPRRYSLSRWSQRNHCRRGWERRIGLSSQEKQRRKELKEECIHLYGSQSPLHFSIKTNNINKVKQLLRTNDPNKYHEGTGETPLHLACRLGLLDIVKLLRRHPGIKTDLLTTGGPQAEKPAGCTPVSLANGNPDILSFLRGFKQPKDSVPVQDNTSIMESELQSLVDALKAENEGLRSEIKELEPEAKALDGYNRELKEKLEKMKKQDVKVMGTELPREKPNDTRKLAEVLSNVRKLEQELTACQERLWDEKENEAKCSICVDRLKDTVLFPCGHLFCFTCSQPLSECPKCQKPIERQLQTSK